VDAGKKCAVLLNVIGDKLICNLLSPQEPAEKPLNNLVALLKLHYTLKISVIMQQFWFHSHTYKTWERVAAFTALWVWCSPWRYAVWPTGMWSSTIQRHMGCVQEFPTGWKMARNNIHFQNSYSCWKKYFQLEKKLDLVIMLAVKKMLDGRHFSIYSDHQPLSYLLCESKGVPAMAASW